MQPKTEPGSPPDSNSTNPNNLEDKSIHDLVLVLRGTCQWETFDSVEAVLENRYMRLREENQKLQQSFEMERLKLREEFHLERLSRVYAESEFKKREEICEKGKKVKESYEALLKEVKVNRLVDRKTNVELEKKNNELEVEIKNLKEKCVDSSNEVDVIRTKIVELEDEVLELNKIKKKWEEDDIELGELRKMSGELESKVLELTKSKEKWLDDKNALDGLKIKNDELKETAKKNLVMMSDLRHESRKLAEEKREAETLLEALKRKFIRLRERVTTLEEDLILLSGLDASIGGNIEGDPSADPMVPSFEESEQEDEEQDVPMADSFEENEDENAGDDEFINVVVDEAAPLPRNEDDHHTLGVAASTQPPSKGSKDAQGASSSAGGRVKLENEIEIINLDDDDQSMPQGIHEKKASFGITVKIEEPSSSGALTTQQKSKFGNAVDTVKRKFSFSDSETSTSTSSDGSCLDNLTIRSDAKKKKM
ncbi:chromatin-remodeling ATPase INO80 isoform X2 [Medicago truncatula]|uniref:Uncharacterized protein n=1 Tax=Medicago truncatula TaxID=3880 RepID=A0A072UH69_MEDTR|nr:chromatin-remodeling ATPase INO80 isoform X2 [Medicago truncatula]KEH28453.1 hypothetical protein MTR_5g094850 [Medicago truncatula]